MTSVNPGPSSTSTPNAQSVPFIAGSYTFGTLPSGVNYPLGCQAYTTDQGPVYWNGTNWIISLLGQGSSLAGLYNLERGNTNRWRAARGKVKAGIANARLLCVGNSITAGFDSTGVGVTNPASLSYPTQLAQILTTAAVPFSWQSWCGGQNIADFNFQDNRIVMGSWTNAGLGTFGGNAMQLAATGQTLTSFTPLTAVDTVEVIALRNNNTAITIAVDGGATLFTFNAFSVGSLSMASSGPHTLGSLGNHAIQANISSAGSTYLVGMIAYNSAIKEVTVLRAGWQGATAANFNNAAWTYTDGVKVVAPDLSLIAVTRNDASGGGEAVAPFMASYQKIITACLISGDVILVIEPMGSLAPATYAPYVAAIYTLANANNLPVIDFTTLWDSYANISTWYADATHPNGFAYGEMARQIGQILSSF